MTDLLRQERGGDSHMNGPFGLLYRAKQQKTPVLIQCRNNKKLTAVVRDYDEHFNMILQDVQEIWADQQYREIGTVFLRGDSVVVVANLVEQQKRES